MQFPDPSLLDFLKPIISQSTNRAESKALTEEEILFNKKQNDHERSEQVKNVFNSSMTVLIILAATLTAACLTVRALHLLLPNCILWIDVKRLETLDHLGQLVITGALGGVAYKYFNKQIET